MLRSRRQQYGELPVQAGRGRGATVWRAIFGAAVLLVVALFSDNAAAQICNFRCNPTPPVTANSAVATQAALLDIGSRFLQRLGALSSFPTAASPFNNPQGGGADAPADRYRTWLEGYGLRSHTDAQGDFLGDRRKTYGVVAGAGMTVAPGINLGLSVDQSRTDVNVAGGTQSGQFDLTQIAAIASFERGPWNLGTSVVHGMADINTTRLDAGTSTASYDARLWAAMAELSYFWALPNNSRIVPKLTFDWTRSDTDAFAETGGANPASGTAVTTKRVRAMVGGEAGHSWLVDRTIMDFLLYARLVNNLTQDMGQLQVTDTVNAPQFVTGVRESKYGMDGGATLSAKLTDAVRVYAVYDGRFRTNYNSHSGIVGAEFRF